MSESKHTPGPWRLHLVNDTLIVAPDGTYIAYTCGEYDDDNIWPIMEANARLIASAPDLLAALKAFPGFTDDATIGDKWIETMRAAIAKAEGQQ